MLVVVFFSSCGPTVAKGMRGKKDDCPYQRLQFIGSSTVTSEKGVEVLDSIGVALNLEKGEFLKGVNGNAATKLKARVANITKEVGTFEIPIREENATEYVRLSNSICTLRKDLYEGVIYNTPELRQKAVEQYTNLLNVVEDLKKKLE